MNQAEEQKNLLLAYPFYNIKFLKSFLKNNNIWFKKSFGQNFLVDKNIILNYYNAFDS